MIETILAENEFTVHAYINSYNGNDFSCKLGPLCTCIWKVQKGIRIEEMLNLGQHIMFVKILQLVYSWDYLEG